MIFYIKWKIAFNKTIHFEYIQFKYMSEYENYWRTIYTKGIIKLRFLTNNKNGY